MLTRKSKYGLKALFYLAEHNKLTHIQELADQERIPKKFLEAILLELKRHGILDSKRGKEGGYMINRPLNEISIGEVIRVLDGYLAPVRCVSETAYKRCEECESEESCEIRGIMKKVRDQTAGILDGTSVQDIVSHKDVFLDKTLLNL